MPNGTYGGVRGKETKVGRCEHWHAHNGAALFTALGMVSEATSRTNAYYSALSKLNG